MPGYIHHIQWCVSDIKSTVEKLTKVPNQNKINLLIKCKSIYFFMHLKIDFYTNEINNFVLKNFNKAI